MKTELKGHSLLGGLSVKESGVPFRAVNPATDEAIEPDYFPIEVSAVNAVAQRAQRAFESYRHTSGKQKAALLRAMADAIDGVVDDLVERTTAETALPEPRVRGETARTTGQLRLFAQLVEEGSWVDARIETAIPDRQPLPKPDVRSMNDPLGPVVVFCASNFPLAFSVAGGDTAAALAAGCPVIVKAHHSHPGTAEIVGRAVEQAVKACGMLDGTFSLVFGGGRDVGIALVSHPVVQAVGFTGSRSGGLALVKAAQEREQPIPVYAEMSSINPVVLFPEALRQNAEAIAKGLHGSVTLGMGQFCTNPGLVLLPAGEGADTLSDTLCAAMAETGDGSMLNSGIASAYRNILSEFRGLADNDSGIEVLHLAAGDTGQGKCRAGTAVFRVTATAFLEHEDLHDEAFGPATMLVTYQSPEELIQVIESLEGQLTGTVHATDGDLSNAGNVLSALQAKVGRLVFGGFPTGVEVCHSMMHGGPFPSTSDGRSTSVGTLAIQRFVRTFCYQNAPDALLPDEVKNGNPLGIERLVNGKRTTEAVSA